MISAISQQLDLLDAVIFISARVAMTNRVGKIFHEKNIPNNQRE
jgi:hypothetical protein